MNELDAMTRIIEQVGIVGVLLIVLLAVVRRYDKLGDSVAKKLDAVNEKRVEEAKETAEVAVKALELATRLVDGASKHAMRTVEASEAMKTLETAADRIVVASNKLSRSASGRVISPGDDG